MLGIKFCIALIVITFFARINCSPSRIDVSPVEEEFVDKILNQHEQLLNTLKSIQDLTSVGCKDLKNDSKIQKEIQNLLTEILNSDGWLLDCPDQENDISGIISLISCKIRESKDLIETTTIQTLSPLRKSIEKLTKCFQKFNDMIGHWDITNDFKNQIEQASQQIQVLSQLCNILGKRGSLLDSTSTNKSSDSKTEIKRRAQSPCKLQNVATGKFLYASPQLYNSKKRLIYTKSKDLIKNIEAMYWNVIDHRGYELGAEKVTLLKNSRFNEFLYAFDTLDPNLGHDFSPRNVFTFVGNYDAESDSQSHWKLLDMGNNLYKIQNVRFGELLGFEQPDEMNNYVFTRKGYYQLLSEDKILWKKICDK